MEPNYRSSAASHIACQAAILPVTFCRLLLVATEFKAAISGKLHTALTMLVQIRYRTKTAALLCLDALSADEQGQGEYDASKNQGRVTGTA